MRIIWLKKQRLRNACVATRNGSCGCFVAPPPVPFFAPLWATLLSMDMSSTRRAQLTTGVQGGRSGPPAPHPLLTSLAAQLASGDANILTSGECELLRRDAKVRADAGLLAWHRTRTASSTSMVMAAPRVMSGVHASAYSALAGLARAGVWRDALLRRRRWPSSGWRHLQGTAPSPRPRGRGARRPLRTAAPCRSPPVCSERHACGTA